MRLAASAIGAIAAMFAVGAAAAAPQSLRDRFNAETTAGVAAEKSGDLGAAAKDFERANGLIPNYPPVMAERAKVATARGDLSGALDLIARYAGFGLTGERFQAPAFDKARADPRYAAIAARFAANVQPIGKLTTVAELPAEPFLAETVAYDPARRRFLVTAVHARTIVQIDRSGVVRPFLDPAAQVPSVFNLALDSRRGVLWATVSGAPQASNYQADETGVGALLEIDLRTGQVLHRFDAPKAAEARGFGCLLLAPDGVVYVSDGLTGEIWRLRRGATALELFTPAGVLTSPHGLVPTPDGRRLIVADYVLGLMSVDRTTGAVTRVAAPDDAELLWIDGLTHRGRDLIAVQNGTTRPYRVVDLSLDKDWRRIVRWRVLAANHPGLDEPTSGVVVSNDFVFVSRSQWNDFADDGTLKATTPKAPLVARLRLPKSP